LCSEEFVNSLSNKSLSGLRSTGKHSFKNISEEKEMFEIGNENKNSFFIDPVCRMLILRTDKATKHPGSENIFFCSSDCRNIYVKNEPVNSAIR
jgi:YHS domain-containing protein